MAVMQIQLSIQMFTQSFYTHSLRGESCEEAETLYLNVRGGLQYFISFYN